MGETNHEARRLIAEVLGSEPELVMNDDGTMSLRLGDIVLTAEAAFWSDPSAYLHTDGTLTVSWGGQTVRIPPAPRGSWTPEIHRNPLIGKARQVF